MQLFAHVRMLFRPPLEDVPVIISMIFPVPLVSHIIAVYNCSFSIFCVQKFMFIY